MELVDRMGGLGKYTLSPSEAVKMQILMDLTSYPRNEALYCVDILGNCDLQRRQFTVLMQELFPTAKPYRYDDGRLHVIARENQHYLEGLSPYSEREITLRAINLQEPTIFIPSELVIIQSLDRKIEEYFVSVKLENRNYKPDCVDDIVQILGQREQPTLNGAQPIRYKHADGSKWTDYGIAEVHRLEAILKLYERAEDLLKSAHARISISEEEMGILRRDSLEHENRAIRELSAERYRKALEQLTLH